MDVFSGDKYYKLIDKTVEYNSIHKLYEKCKKLYKKDKKLENIENKIYKFKFELPKNFRKLQNKSIKEIYKCLKKKLDYKHKKVSSMYNRNFK
jgi:hypothetical protein